MKMADIVVGEEYSYARGTYDTPQRVRVLEKNVVREVWSDAGAWSRRVKGTRADGVRIAYVAGKRHSAVRDEVPITQIRMTWAEQEASDALSKQRDERVAQAKEAREKDIRAKVEALGLTWEKYRYDPHNGYRLVDEELTDLAERYGS